jgi:serine/threonine-protein kinase SRPK3
MEGADQTENETAASTQVIEDFDQLEAQPQDARAESPEAAESEEPKSEPQEESSQPQNSDLDEIDLPEPSQKKPAPKRPAKAFAEDSHIPDSDRAPFEPLSSYLDPEYGDLSDSSEDEGMPDYKIGGYHPVHVGECFMGRYIIIQKLGWGHFSTVWLTKDLWYDTYVALKIQKSSQNYLEAAYDEVEILDTVSSNWQRRDWQEAVEAYYKGDPDLEKWRGPEGCACVQLLNSFLHYGPNGKHFVMVFEIMGVNLLEVIKAFEYKGVPIPITRKIAKQCLIGLDYLHRMCKIIHTDLKPENAILALRQAELEEIAQNGCLKDPKHKPTHVLSGRTKFSDIALGTTFQKKYGMKQPVAVKNISTTAVLDPGEEPEPLTYAELVPGYSEMTKSQKNRARKKWKAKLETVNEERLAAWKKAKAELEAQTPQSNEPESQSPEDFTPEDGLTPKDLEEKKKRGPQIDEEIRMKICDLGNGCWTHHHFSSEIQTR